MPDDFAFVFTKQQIYVSEGRVANGNTGFLKIFTNQSYEKCIQLYLVFIERKCFKSLKQFRSICFNPTSLQFGYYNRCIY